MIETFCSPLLLKKYFFSMSPHTRNDAFDSKVYALCIIHNKETTNPSSIVFKLESPFFLMFPMSCQRLSIYFEKDSVFRQNNWFTSLKDIFVNC